MYRLKCEPNVLKVNRDRAFCYAYLEPQPVYNGESYIVAAGYNDE